MELERVTVISLEDFENPDLLLVKKSRSKAEYCWTCTSSTIDYLFEKYNLSECTYIDADLIFYNKPSVLLNNLQNKSVLITEHRYPWLSRMYEEKRAGRFCVQFITFYNVPESRKVLGRWISQCKEWCYSRYEDGKFGDQKYLDEWPALYNNIEISEHHGAGIAPWNLKRYTFQEIDGRIKGTEVKTSNQFDIIFFHYHFVRFLDNGYVDVGWNRISEKSLKLFYIPYIKRINEIENNLEQRFKDYKTILAVLNPKSIKDFLKYYFKRFTGYNLLLLRKLI
jgi:hypothetical protein